MKETHRHRADLFRTLIIMEILITKNIDITNNNLNHDRQKKTSTPPCVES